MSDRMTFAERIKAELERQEMSYTQLADKMGVATATVSRYASGKRIPTATTILKAADVLGVTCDYLLGLSDDPHRTSAQPTYTDEEIQKMQDMEQVQIEKAYQLGYEEGKKDAQPERTCVNCGRTANNGGWYADGGTRCPIEEHYALPKNGYCHLWEKRNVTDDDYPERLEE